MEMGKSSSMWMLGIYACVFAAAISFSHCEARSWSIGQLKAPTKLGSREGPTNKMIKVVKRFDVISGYEGYGVSSPFSLPPYDSLAPIPLPGDENTPPSPSTPFCVYSPPEQQQQPPPPPSLEIPIAQPPPSPLDPILNPPSPSPLDPIPNPPSPSPLDPMPNPPFPSPLGPVPNPPPPFTYDVPSPPPPPSPSIYVPSPAQPYYEPTPPYYEEPPSSPSPPFTYSVPGPPPPPRYRYMPPVVYPPPAVPPPPYSAGPRVSTLWCVAKPSVPEPIIQEAMNYACGSGADCDSIQSPSGSCFEPNTVIAHASYAFNSYWQRTKSAGGTCDFGGAAIFVSLDPSNEGCHFIYY